MQYFVISQDSCIFASQEKGKDMNTITLDNATYEEMSDFAKQNNVSIAEMLKNNWHDFLKFVKAKKEKKTVSTFATEVTLEDDKATTLEEFLRRFSGDWENDKSTVDVVAEYRSNNRFAPQKNLMW